MRTISLSAIKAGITRLRLKGGASPDSLYDLQNGYVNSSGIPTIRPGTVHETRLPQGTKGLAVHDGYFYVFSHQEVVMTDARFICAVLRHPTDSSLEIIQIHFSEEYMGALFVVAEFTNNDIFCYWLEDFPEWTADTGFEIGDKVLPTTANGYVYKATRAGSAAVKWAASVPRTVGDIVEPTVYNGFYYECISADGDNPVSGTTEPTWPTVEDATVVEDPSSTTLVYTDTPGDDSNTDPLEGNGANSPGGRYSNPGGTLPDRWDGL